MINIKKITILLVSVCLIASCANRDLTKPIESYTAKEYVLYIKDVMDDGMMNFGSLALTEEAYDGYNITEIAGSAPLNRKYNDLHVLWSNYCKGQNGIKYSSGRCYNKNNDVIFITKSYLKAKHGASQRKSFKTKIILPTKGVENEEYAAVLKEHNEQIRSNNKKLAYGISRMIKKSYEDKPLQ